MVSDETKKKIDWQMIFSMAVIAIVILLLITCVVIKIWVYCEYGDMPITEIPAWALPWLEWGGK